MQGHSAGSSVYSVADYGAMIHDAVRIDAYLRALREVVRPGSVVVDLGTGTGIFALLACRLGARRVYAIEPGDVIQVAREIASADGCGDRIEFLQAMSTEAIVPEPADVLISDLSGALPWFGRHIPSIVDARRRMLAPGAVLIPRRDVAWAAVVDVPDLYARWTGPWERLPLGINMDAARRMVTNTMVRVRLQPANLLTEPRRWGSIDYAEVEDPDIRTRITWTVARAGTGHGVAAGFDRTVIEGICLSNAPDAAEAVRPTIYPTVLYPWPTPVALDEGDVVTVDFEGRLVRQDYIWKWDTRVLQHGADREQARFAQSTFLAVPLSPKTLAARSAGHTPALSEDGRIARLVLDKVVDGMSLGQISHLVATEFRGRFATPQDALDHVIELSRHFC